MAAGALIVAEAGGRVTGMDGTTFDPVAAHLVASNGHVHDQMLAIIREYPQRPDGILAGISPAAAPVSPDELGRGVTTC